MIDSEIPIANREVRATRVSDRCGAKLQLCLLLLVAACLLAACGKKGPPLAPLLKVPVAPPDVAVRRSGRVTTLQLRVPAVNTDNSRPANIERVEVYGFTGTGPTPAEVVKYGTLVAAVPVREPENEEPGSKRDAATYQGTSKPRPPASMANGFDQGDLVTVTEALGSAQAAPVEVKRRGKQPPPPLTDEWQPRLQAPAKAGTVRLYFAVGVNRKGQRGPLTPPQPVPLGPAPSAPGSVEVAYDATGIELTWADAPDVPNPVQAPAAEGELASTPRGIRGVSGGYNVYVARSGEGEASAVSGVDTGAVAKPLNDKPLETASFTDPRVEFGTERCFVVRTVLQQGGEITESEPSQPACVTPVDTFPPEPPKGLAAVASDGAISLIWEASAAADLAGYVIMRSEAGGAPRAITPEPIKETTFRDTTASRGAKYLYTVVAVDTAGNRSAPSNAVEETAR